ncbi:Lrp/AsnC family transcriptional regulator [Sulfitobacter pseudonitzschiae]|uniref:Transcriptional regulator n=1 Tax=Pseudosulfitobacter pseudonitzschiae TaxID=1402135 RepID=A0A073J6W9_9RHOB|nr:MULTISPECIES: Lrp/AsnC family transcriptional regulator [Roseobacteraceae]KEJ97456.1 transcriptional regulator [Pseudosulfitobacter pseudonitzschiae]MBM1814892.1 Lrp/AsnC family transcriptional regulator [Pseudosulfitobacter pseudonitzschiae]MBM1831886.1 Lrp/AsnC family transcriptional regulator [Pseudosulfitobacter pseudonitzschiae]MBM1836751.1 Lrp/AsnC family transcriptional regulator [Pseudosulfitobacter pseudonitzschiae]MBM1841598.1 Lrp/AsnC family transcriptional regulator [Pseudosulfi|tara:strand:+ start:1024 stop:1482 length:459 start_codon:yes stop_codon:yes gene_type:complete
MLNLDDIDRNLLSELQRDASQSLDSLSDTVGLSRNACWRRIRLMEDAGIITARVTLVDPAKIGLPLMVFMQIRTGSHDPDWQARFAAAAKAIPGILSVYRMTGDLDYLVRARVADMAGYDRLYQQLIARLPVADISASFVMEDIKDSTALPL